MYKRQDHCFGCAALLSSEFCINCANSVKLSRCLEVDFSRSSSDCYFCHNVENCTDCLFSFNAKNLRYAIGNCEVGREKYLKVKKLLLEWMSAQLGKKRTLPFRITNIGAKN